MAQHFCSGPAHIYVAVPDSNVVPTASTDATPYPIDQTLSRVIQYLGTAEKQPRIVIDTHFEPLFNDLGGGVLPLDYMFQGEEGIVSVVFTRWNEPVVRRIRSMPRPGAIPGRNVNGDLGTFMGLEGCSYPLYVQFPYAAKLAMNGMPFGYRFWSSFLQGPFEVMPGTTPLRKQLIWKCTRHFGTNPFQDALVQNTAPLNSYLYDHDLTALAGVPIN